MSVRSDRARRGILKVLDESEKPLGAYQLASLLLSMGIDLQPRSIRHHLLELDAGGLTRLVSRRLGREITKKGRDAVLDFEGLKTMEVVSAKIESLGYRMSFDVSSGKGTVIANVSYVDPEDFAGSMKEIQLVIGQGFGIGTGISVARPGEKIGDLVVPDGVLAIGTVCSMTLNRILQKEGIPVVSRFGGLLEVRERKMAHFLEMIEYSGSTLDPLEVFLRAEMTRVRDVVLRGSGVICASFREFPSVARDHVKSIERVTRSRGLGGILAVGRPGQPLFGVAVSEGYCGMIIAGGLNPIASAREAGIRLTFQPLAGLVDIADFTTTREALRG